MQTLAVQVIPYLSFELAVLNLQTLTVHIIPCLSFEPRTFQI
jgi:hypothetical protein